MKLERRPPPDADGLILAHSYKLSSERIPKGTRLNKKLINSFVFSKIPQILCAIPEKGDVHENKAAQSLGKIIDPEGLFSSRAHTGRINFKAPALSLIRYDSSLLDKLNMIDEAITFALVQHNQLLAPGDLAATLKIIPFFVSGDSLKKAKELLIKSNLFEFKPLSPKICSLIQTQFDWQKKHIFAVTEKVTKERLERLDCTLAEGAIISHDKGKIAEEILLQYKKGVQLLLISGASAIIDKTDDIPTALVEQGGEIIQFGLAVDPGNLLLIGKLNEMVVIGMPGCAKSPKLNGLDWILQFVLAGIDIDKKELASLAAGGLLMEIASRPLPRALINKKPNRRKVLGALLAAGFSKGMVKTNKLLEEIDGMPLIRRIAVEMLNSDLDDFQIILGFEVDKVLAALKDLPVQFLLNPLWESGTGSFINAAVKNIDNDISDLLVMSGDLPDIKAKHINYLIQSHYNLSPHNNRITVPSYKGQLGDAIIWGQAFFPDLMKLSGETGNNKIFSNHPSALNLVEFNSDCVIANFNTENVQRLV